LPDDAVVRCSLDDDSKPTSAMVLEKLASCDTEFHKEANVLVGAPTDVVKASSRRIDRLALEKFARKALAEQHVSISDWYDLQAHCGEAPEYSWLSILAGILVPGGVPNDTGQPNAERLYGTLTPAQREFLRQGQVVPYNSLAGAQLQAADTLVFGEQYSNFRETVGPKGTLVFDPCDELPGGLLAKCGLRAKHVRNEEIRFLDPAEKNYPLFYRVNVNDDSKFFFWSGPPPRIPKAGMQTTMFEVQSFEQIEFSWEFSEGHVRTVTFRGPNQPSTEGPVPLERLPEPYKTAAKKGVESLKGFGGGRLEGGTDPSAKLRQ